MQSLSLASAKIASQKPFAMTRQDGFVLKEVRLRCGGTRSDLAGRFLHERSVPALGGSDITQYLPV